MLLSLVTEHSRVSNQYTHPSFSQQLYTDQNTTHYRSDYDQLNSRFNGMLHITSDGTSRDEVKIIEHGTATDENSKTVCPPIWDRCYVQTTEDSDISLPSIIDDF